VYCPIEPFWFRHRCVTIDNHRSTTVFRSPVVTDGQAKLIRFARRLSIEGEIADLSRAAPLQRLRQSSMRDDYPSFVEHIMADQSVNERCDALSELRRIALQLF